MTRFLAAAWLMVMAGALAACSDVLEVEPINEVEAEDAIVDPTSARAALAGVYDGLQDTDYYGGDLQFFSDLPSDDVEHTGTFTTFRQADLNNLTADNGSIEALWDNLYQAVARANTLIAALPGVPDLDDDERNQMLGEAYFARALTYHNLVKLWGEQTPSGMGVPLRLTPPATVGEASQIARATTGEVYQQILDDLAEAEQLMSDDASTTTASLGAVKAIEARVHLYRGDWAAAEDAAEAVIAMGYGLAPEYPDLFDADGIATVEDIFKLSFTAVEYQNIGYYYRARGAGGRAEVAPTPELLAAYDPNYDGSAASYNPVDERGQWNVAFRRGNPYGSKYPTGAGAEDVHVIRFAEVLLIHAEAEARQGNLIDALASLNPIRVRAGLAPLVLGVDVVSQQDVIDAILHERRLELAYEGDRFPDLVRTGRAMPVLEIPEFRTRFPIPQNELDVAPNLQQNPGY